MLAPAEPDPEVSDPLDPVETDLDVPETTDFLVPVETDPLEPIELMETDPLFSPARASATALAMEGWRATTTSETTWFWLMAWAAEEERLAAHKTVTKA